jgi:hypothetical protein
MIPLTALTMVAPIRYVAIGARWQPHAADTRTSLIGGKRNSSMGFIAFRG